MKHEYQSPRHWWGAVVAAAAIVTLLAAPLVAVVSVAHAAPEGDPGPKSEHISSGLGTRSQPSSTIETVIWPTQVGPITVPAEVPIIRLRDYPGIAVSPRDFHGASSHVNQMRGLDSYPRVEVLPDAELDEFIASVTDHLRVISGSPDGRRLLDFIRDGDPLPTLIGETQSHLFLNEDGQPSNVRVVITKKATGGESRYWGLDPKRTSDGHGSSGTIEFCPDTYIVSRGVDGKPMLLDPAQVLAHELTHASHSLSGSRASGTTEHTQVSVGPNGPVMGKNRVPTEELLTHGGADELDSVFGLDRQIDGWVNPFDADNDSRVAEYQKNPGLSDADRVEVRWILAAREAARAPKPFSEMSIGDGMTIGGEHLPVRAHYAPFRTDIDNDAYFMTGPSGQRGYRSYAANSGVRQSDIPVSARVPFSPGRDFFGRERPIPGLTLIPVPDRAPDSAASDALCAVSAGGGSCGVESVELTPEEGAGALDKFYEANPSLRPVGSVKPVESVTPGGPGVSPPVSGERKVTPKALGLDGRVLQDKAGDFLEKEVLSDKGLRKVLPVRTKVPMGVDDLQASAIVTDAKIGAVREGTEEASRELDEIFTALGDDAGKTPGGLAEKIRIVAAVDEGFAHRLRASMDVVLGTSTGAVSRGLGRGAMLAGGFTAIKTFMDEHATVMDKVEATAGLLPVVGPLVGLGEGIASGDAETIAVNSVALASILIAQAVPAVGELVDAGLFVYTVVKSVIAWWSTLDEADKKGLEECATELIPGKAIIDMLSEGYNTHCRQAMVNTGVTILNALRPVIAPSGPSPFPTRGGGMGGY